MCAPAPRSSDRIVRFGPANPSGSERWAFELDLETLDLRRHGTPIELRPQALRVLALLLRHEGTLVTIERVRREIWGDQHLEWRNSLHQCVRDLRRTLADEAGRPRFVATVARRGYRFIGETLPAAEFLATGAGSGLHPRLSRAWRRPLLAFAAGVAAAALLPVSILLLCAFLAS